ncbi:MAG: succinylglutamate desuccinylase/aspartoacylase family protein [Woeseiaceae bacterium]
MRQRWFTNDFLNARSCQSPGIHAFVAALLLLAATVASAGSEEAANNGGDVAEASDANWISDEELADDADGGGDFLASDIVDDELGEHIDTPEDVFVGPPMPEETGEVRPESEQSKPPVAANIDLSQPVAPSEALEDIDIGLIAPPIEPTLAVYAQKSLLLLGAEVAASTSTRLAWSPAQSFAGIAAPTPVLVVNGANRGPTLCVTAAIHGDELNGIEVVRRVLYDLEPESLSGAVIGVPIVNLQGFRRSSRYLPDRRDLNRYFPGNPNGSSASRLAHSFFTEVISQCDALVDLHTGSFQRTNLPQLRADLRNPKVVELTQGFGSTVVLHSDGARGTLRRAATDAGIPTITLEAGGPARVQDDAVSHSTKGVMTLLNELQMYENVTEWGTREPVYYRSRWIRADQGGVLFSKVGLGESVELDQLLGTITDPITNVQTELRASDRGRVLGMALDQFVMPGFAAFRIGIEAPRAIDLPTESIGMKSDTVEHEQSVSDQPNPGQGVPVERESPTLAEADGEVSDEYEGYEDDEILDVRDYLEDSE